MVMTCFVANSGIYSRVVRDMFNTLCMILSDCSPRSNAIIHFGQASSIQVPVPNTQLSSLPIATIGSLNAKRGCAMR